MRSLISISLLIGALGTPTFAQIYEAGTTYLPYQHNGSCGRMIGTDSFQNVHVSWMKSFDEANSRRHVFYNFWDPVIEAFTFADGAQVDVMSRAGYTTLAVLPSGYAFPAFHQMSPDAQMHACVGFDYSPGIGAFSCDAPAWIRDDGAAREIMWPKIARDPNGNLHMVCSENRPLPDATRIYYSKGIPVYDPDGFCIAIDWQRFDDLEFVLFDSTDNLTVDVACARHSARVARAWIAPGRELCVQTSEDSGLTWSAVRSIVRYNPPDSLCYVETNNGLCCDRDTLRAYYDLSLLFDELDQLHVAFTAVGYYYFPDPVRHQFLDPFKATIWHWSESTDTLSPVAVHWIPDAPRPVSPGLKPMHAMVQRPSLAIDPGTGDLHCAYLQYDTSAYSAHGYFNADVFASVSTNHGLTWSVGTNVTHTRPDSVPAPSGQSLNEQDVTAAELVSLDRLHLFYDLDYEARDAGGFPCSMLYQRVDVDSIARTPLMPAIRFHVELEPCDVLTARETGGALPSTVTVQPAHPNPFNGTTLIRFALSTTMRVRIRIYDVLGREVDVLRDARMEAGTHEIAWRPSRVASGLYFVRFEAGAFAHTQKLMYLR